MQISISFFYSPIHFIFLRVCIFILGAAGGIRHGLRQASHTKEFCLST